MTLKNSGNTVLLARPYIVCPTKVFIQSEKGMKLFKMGKNVHIKLLIWYVVGEMVKKMR